MNPEKGLDRDWEDYSHCIGHLEAANRKLAPDFFIISPPKTGSTWLGSNLTCHPEVFIPEIKELKYFSHFWRHWDINQYFQVFDEGAGRKKGDASPAYSILPPNAIATLHSFLPDLKLIFLMRDPVERAWSQAKHNWAYQEANFCSCAKDFNQIEDSEWIENFTHAWSMTYSDYRGSLQRWTQVYPKNQIFVGFFEAIRENPAKLLGEIFRFLGIEGNVDWSEFKVQEQILKGMASKLPENLRTPLQRIYQKQITFLKSYLKKEFKAKIPSSWQTTANKLDPTSTEIDGPTNKQNHAPAPLSSFRENPKESTLREVLDMDIYFKQVRLIDTGWKGFNIVFYDKKFYAVAQEIGEINIFKDDLEPHAQKGKLFIGNSLEEVQRLIEEFSQVPDIIKIDYKGFNLVYFDKMYYAVAMDAGEIRWGETSLKEHIQNKKCFLDGSYKNVLIKLDNHLKDQDKVFQISPE